MTERRIGGRRVIGALVEAKPGESGNAYRLVKVTELSALESLAERYAAKLRALGVDPDGDE